MLEYFSKIFQDFRNALRSFERDGRTKDCFHFNHDECNGKIIKAHSLQRNGVLSIIEEEVDGNMVVYCFQRMKKNPFGQYEGFEKIGKGNASTFFGFCGKHDTDIFVPIENNEIDMSNNQHKFLLCYRAVAKEYHRKVEQVKSYKNNSLLNRPELKNQQESGIQGSQTAVDELEEHKTSLNEMLKNNDFDKLRYFSHTYDYTIPIACSSITTPKFHLDNSIFNFSDDPDVKYESIYLTVIPTMTKTHILYACLPSDEKSMKFLDDLETLEEEQIGEITSSILVNDIENTFISPRIYDSLTEEEQTHLIQSIELSDEVRFMFYEFRHIGINFFQEKNKKTENNFA
ncbi:MAG: hypothetical protein R2795_05775 [Saprospiraceae bacterium]